MRCSLASRFFLTISSGPPSGPVQGSSHRHNNWTFSLHISLILTRWLFPFSLFPCGLTSWSGVSCSVQAHSSLPLLQHLFLFGSRFLFGEEPSAAQFGTILAPVPPVSAPVLTSMSEPAPQRWMDHDKSFGCWSHQQGRMSLGSTCSRAALPGASGSEDKTRI